MASKQPRSTRRVKARHRAHKRDSAPAAPITRSKDAAGKPIVGRDARKREKRAAIHAQHVALAADAVQAVKDREDAAILAQLEAEEKAAAELEVPAELNAVGLPSEEVAQ